MNIKVFFPSWAKRLFTAQEKGMKEEDGRVQVSLKRTALWYSKQGAVGTIGRKMKKKKGKGSDVVSIIPRKTAPLIWEGLLNQSKFRSIWGRAMTGPTRSCESCIKKQEKRGRFQGPSTGQKT